MIGHTPGPWIVDRFHTIKTQNGETLMVNGVSLPMGNHPDIVEINANTRLIAVAPDFSAATDVCLENPPLLAIAP